jgi:hypothetical protein
MPDQVIDAAAARSVQANATTASLLCAWIIEHDPPEHPGKYVARFATTHPTIYVVLADRLAELQAMLPPGLARSAVAETISSIRSPRPYHPVTSRRRQRVFGLTRRCFSVG